jgi:hypothetical protein
MKTLYDKHANPPIQRLCSITPKVLLLVVCLLLAFFECVQTVQASNVYMLQAQASDPWFDTGIVIPNNSMLSIIAAGIVNYGNSPGQSANANGGDVSAVDFFSGALLPTTEIHSLIGKIGGTTSSATVTGTLLSEGLSGKGPGFVGASYDQAVTGGGELFLGYNDIPFFTDANGNFVYVDNSGSFSVTIAVTPIPEPSMAGFIIGGLAAFSFMRKFRVSK